ncbi:hypothetical protein CMI37_30880 [Candidatus Pacearchaeota archaeon]|nr:hypothetical protein [Candidatus Pacearchaeota archaeon]|tara:strand:- start:1042 stop:1386 length:345 start_codon:yes stop_codon:yes gene_type:complete
MRFSRKTLFYIIGILTAGLSVVKEAFGLEVDFKAVGAGLVSMITYLQFQAKVDLKKLQENSDKLKDKKFWLALIAPMLVAITEASGIVLPTAEIIAVMTLLLTLLFGRKLANGD